MCVEKLRRFQENVLKIGFQSSAYNGLSLLQELQFAVENQVDFFDIFFDGFLPENISTEELNFIFQMKKNGMKFTVHLPININKCSEKELQQLSNFVERLQPVTATVHFDKLEWSFLEKLITLFSCHTRLCIENTIPDNNPFYNSNYLSFMTQACQKYDVYSTFDTGHCNVNCGNVPSFVQQLLERGIRIGTVHNHDNSGTKDEHQFVGYGNIDFKGFYQELKKAKQNPMLVIEHWNNNIQSLKALKDLE